jgi:CBS domain-containing protein
VVLVQNATDGNRTCDHRAGRRRGALPRCQPVAAVFYWRRRGRPREEDVMTIVSKLMQTDMVTARADETVASVARRMSERGVGAVLLVDGPRLAGLFSERDLLARVVAAGRDPASTPVGDVATREVVTVEVDTPLRRCAEILRAKKFRHLAVTRSGDPVGILSARDFFDVVAEGLERLVGQRDYQAALAEGADPYDHLGGGYDR